MKTRQGFVSNSSSSSFICDISGNCYEGYDCEYDVEYIQCENGHEFVGDFLPKFSREEIVEVLDKKYKGWREDYSVADEDIDCLEDCKHYDDFTYNLPEEFCPLCSMRYVSDNAMRKYLLKELGLTHAEASANIASRFAHWKDFANYIEEVK